MMSDSDLVEHLHEITKKTIKSLDSIWDEIGLDGKTRHARNQMFCKHVQDLYNDMLEEAEANKNELVEKVNRLIQQVMGLSTDLSHNISIPHEDTPLFEAKIKLEQKIEKYQKVFEERKNEIKKLELKERYLVKALGKESRHLPTSPLPSEDEIHDFKTYLEELSDQKFQREEIFLKKKSAIIDIMNELKIVPSLDFERNIVLGDDSVFIVSEENMIMLEEFHTSLINQLEDTKVKIAELRENVSNLWELLEESPEVRSQFLNANPGHSVDTLKALKAEIARCQEKKKENIRAFVEKMRQELIVMWEKCRFSPQQKAEFVHFHSDCYTEDLLSLHELQMERVKAHYEKNKHIYELVTKREQLWDKMLDLEQRANQPDRYKNRGGQLLREEKERKAIACKLPKIEQELLAHVEQYESETGTPFLILGNRIAEIIEQAWEEHKENKHITLSARKHARENVVLTPCKSRLGASRLQLPHTPVMQLSASKRKINTPFSASKRPRCDEKLLRTAPPKLQVNGSSIRRVSTERRKRVEKVKRRSKISMPDKDHTLATTISDYDGFEKGLQLKPSCRSSLFPDKLHQSNKLKPTSGNILLGTPRKIAQSYPYTPGTPNRSHLRPKSPIISTPKLATAPGNLPILI